jgi:hypothetical protein
MVVFVVVVNGHHQFNSECQQIVIVLDFETQLSYLSSRFCRFRDVKTIVGFNFFTVCVSFIFAFVSVIQRQIKQ